MFLLFILTAIVESVQPGNIISAHLGGFAEGYIAVRNRFHSGEVVLGEGIPKALQITYNAR